ncbi:MAG: peptidoglycan DD-metalloendopeptidase family protein [Chloroflexota bacterium]
MRLRPRSALPLPASRPGRRARRLLLLLLIVPLMSGLFVAPAGRVAGDELSDAISKQKAIEKRIASQKNQVSQLNAFQADLRAEIAATARALRGINADLGAIRVRVNAMAKQIEEVKAKYDALVMELEALDAELVRVEAEEVAKRQQLGERRAYLASRLRNAYDTDRTSMLETFLSGGSFSDVLTEVSYQLDIGEQDRALAQQIIEDQETLAALHQTVLSTRQETNLLRQETAVQKLDLDKQMADLQEAQAQLKKLERDTARALARQKAAFAKMARNKAALRKSMAAAAASQRALAAKIDRLVREQARQGRIPSEYNGTLEWPMAGSVTQNFGCTGFAWEPPLGDCAHFHKGIDIAAPMYTPIRAAGAGTVVFAGPNPYDPYPKAWIVIIAHSANLQTWYGHVDNSVRPPTVHPGQWVRAGQVIAYNGMTGRTTGPHLHWMAEFNGGFANPRVFL